jgi:pimeloyl-ACP methyl ester carboxylesterase
VLKSFADGRLFGGSWGSGVPAVLALHGWRRTHLDFAPVFGDRNHGSGVGVVGPDLFGFGATPPPPQPWGTDEYARQLLPLFDEPGVLADRIVVVGHSFGGRVAVRLHALVPGRIERMVLCGVPLLDRQGRRVRPAATYRLVRRLHRAGLIGEARMEAARSRYGSPDYRAAEGVMREVFVKILAEQYADELGSISCPVDLLWGEEDSDVPVEVARRARGLFPEATLTVLPGVGHLVPTEAPQDLLAAVLGRDLPANSGPADHQDRPEPSTDQDPMAGSL